MIIRLKVFEQTLSIIDTRTIPRQGSKDYLVLQFTFSGDWDGLDKLCYLQKDDVSQPIDVVDGLVEVPEWFTQQDSFDITLYGHSGATEVPTNVVSLRLQKSNTLWENDAPEPQPGWLAKVIELNNHPSIPGSNGFWLVWDADNAQYVESELPLPDISVGPQGPQGEKGDPGKDGYSPVRGVDYWTPDDQREIVETVETDIAPTLQSIQSTADSAVSIAKGRATGYVFDTIDDLDTALTDESFVANLVLGDNLYIRATDVPDYWWDGAHKQKLETERPDLSGLVKDVKIGDQSVVAGDAAIIPVASATDLGVGKFTENNGLHNAGDGSIAVSKATDVEIAARQQHKPIVPSNLDVAVKAAMCDGQGAAWSDGEKVGAWKRQAIVKTAMDAIAVAGAKYYLGDQTAVTIVLPDNAEVGQEIEVVWYNGSTAATLSITGTMLPCDYAPSANSRSEINALWDGRYWSVLTVESAVDA